MNKLKSVSGSPYKRIHAEYIVYRLLQQCIRPIHFVHVIQVQYHPANRVRARAFDETHTQTTKGGRQKSSILPAKAIIGWATFKMPISRFVVGAWSAVVDLAGQLWQESGFLNFNFMVENGNV